jgi:hypothetical protein
VRQLATIFQAVVMVVVVVAAVVMVVLQKPLLGMSRVSWASDSLLQYLTLGEKGIKLQEI